MMSCVQWFIEILSNMVDYEEIVYLYFVYNDYLFFLLMFYMYFWGSVFCYIFFDIDEEV